MAWLLARQVGVFAGLAFVLALGAPEARGQEFFGTGGAVDIPGGAPGTTIGPGNPFPSTIPVAGLTTNVAHVSVTLRYLQHQNIGDVGIVLVGPEGQSCLLMGRCGGAVNAQAPELVFDDDSTINLPTVGFPATTTYRPTNCVLGAQNFTVPAPVGPYGSSLGIFRGTNGNGLWRLYIQDFAGGSAGSLEFGWSLKITEAGCPVIVYNSLAGMTIPAGAPGTSSGPASVYPMNIQVSGLTGKIAGVSVRLNNLNHTYPADLDVLLVSPNFQKCLLMSDAGGGRPGVSFVKIGFAHNAPELISYVLAPQDGGTFLATDYESGENLPAPAPMGPYSASLDVFNGSDPNGYWSLYVNDDADVDVGSLGYWELVIHMNERCPADFNASGRLEVADIFAFLSAWFAGCP